METVKCQCGHVNPHGTILCEACGIPLEEQSDKLLDMRYEGSARRSQTYNKTFVDKIWNFFSSVKVGVWLIVITLVASSFGTIFPQELFIPPTVPPAEFYEEEYGFLGKMYYELGFHNLYGSWWYMLLVASIAISLVICSLDRVVPLHRALKKQVVSRNPKFLERQRVFGKSQIDDVEKTLSTIKENMKQKRYNVREDNGNLLAEKGRFSRWGPYVNHVGLIIFLIGAMLRFFPGMYVDEVLWIRDGETKSIPGTDQELYLKNEGFIKEVYDESDEQFTIGMGMPKNFQTDAVLYQSVGEKIAGAEPELEEIKTHKIRVNQPLKHDGYALYQVDYKLNEFSKMAFQLTQKDTNDSFGQFVIDLNQPETMYDLGKGYKVEILNYFPDFHFNSEGNPDTKTRLPNNPAFIFKMYTPTTEEGEISFVGIRTNVEPFGENTYKMSFAGIETRNVSGLVVRLDYTLPIIAVGGAIFMIGVIQGMYWNHRRIWIQRVNDEVWVAGHTNKNWHGIKRDIEKVITGTKVSAPVDQTEEKEKLL